MKYLFLSLLLLSVPVHADKIYNNQKCLPMYLDVMLDFETSRVPPAEIMYYYAQMCIPVKKHEPEYTTLKDAVLSDELVVAIKAKLAEQDLIKL
jgi:hypothetical protein